MTPRLNPLRIPALGLAAFLFVAAFAACDSNPSAAVDEDLTSAELNALTATLSTELNLSTEQASRIDGLFTGEDRPAPGHLWTVAAELQKTLTDEQKAALFEKAEQRRARFKEGMQRRFQEGERGHRFNREDRGSGQRLGRRGERGSGVLSDLLTEEQQEQMNALRDAHREQMNALFEARQDGSLSTEAFREQARALREQLRESVQALLTDEQKAALEQQREERKAQAAERRDAAEAVKAEALGLTGAQETALEALTEEHRAERQALAERVRSGNLDREAVRAEAETLREAHQAALAEILTDEQMEIVEIHHALAGGVILARRGGRDGFRGVRGGPRGFGGRNG